MYLIKVVGRLYEGTSSRAANFEGLSNKNLNIGGSWMLLRKLKIIFVVNETNLFKSRYKINLKVGSNQILFRYFRVKTRISKETIAAPRKKKSLIKIIHKI